MPILVFLTWSKDHQDGGPLSILIGVNDDHGGDHGGEGGVFQFCITLMNPK